MRCTLLFTNFRLQLKDHERSPRQNREVPRRQRGLPGTAGPPHRPRPMGGPMAGGSKTVGSGTHPDGWIPSAIPIGLQRCKWRKEVGDPT